MTENVKKLGIIAGGGSIPKMLIEHCRQNGRPYFVRICGLESGRPAAVLKNLPKKKCRKL